MSMDTFSYNSFECKKNRAGFKCYTAPKLHHSSLTAMSFREVSDRMVSQCGENNQVPGNIQKARGQNCTQHHVWRFLHQPNPLPKMSMSRKIRAPEQRPFSTSRDLFHVFNKDSKKHKYPTLQHISWPIIAEYAVSNR